MFRKIFKMIIAFIIVLNVCTIAYGVDTIDIKSISINNNKTLYLNTDDYFTLDVKTNPSGIKKDYITFSSSSPRIADVDYDGNITAKRKGSATITAEYNNKKSSITVKVSEQSDKIDVRFSIKDISNSPFKEITVTPYRCSDGEILIDEEDDEYYIYLPSGYLVNGKTASYTADKNGVYPFTVYLGNERKTFLYTVKNIEQHIEEESSYDKDNIITNYELLYDYEKKQIVFNLELDRVRTVITPDKKKTISNNVNFYINNIKNNTPYDFTIIVDNINCNYKIIKQGEFYLLVFLSPVDYDNYSTIVKYSGYNFTINEKFTTIPSIDMFFDNGNYNVLVRSDSKIQELFNFNISGIDFRRPIVKISSTESNVLEIDTEDDFALDYIITCDGKYIPIGKGTQGITKNTYKHDLIINYNGVYPFTVVDKAKNRTVLNYEVENKKTNRKHDLHYSVHKYKYTKDLFQNIGIEYKGNNIDENVFEVILPAYMKGTSLEYFNPDSPISRAEIVTIFCRITDLPYDANAFLKNKFTDIENHWARDYISMGSSKRYVKGFKDKTFKPNKNVTRAEFCQMLCNISSFKSKLSSLPAVNNYNFVDINDHWARTEIIKISSRNILTGNNNYFLPDKAITRAEVVNSINKLYNLNPSPIELKYIISLYNKYYNFKDISNHKYYNDIIISAIGMYREKIN